MNCGLCVETQGVFEQQGKGEPEGRTEVGSECTQEVSGRNEVTRVSATSDGEWSEIVMGSC